MKIFTIFLLVAIASGSVSCLPTFGLMLADLGSAVSGGIAKTIYIANGVGSSMMNGAMVAANGIKNTLDKSGFDQIDKAVSGILDINPVKGLTGTGIKPTKQPPTTTTGAAPDTQPAPVPDAAPNPNETTAPTVVP